METALEALSQRIGFRIAPGFSERVIFRELYLLGLTLFDIRDEGSGVELSMSHLAALQEVRALIRAIQSDELCRPSQPIETRRGAA